MVALRHDLVIVGGGILGLGVARRILETMPGCSVAVLEKEPEVALHQSGRNSGVIHTGYNYSEGSLKARACVEGARELIAFCREEGISHRVCGKLVLAIEGRETLRVGALLERGRRNGAEGLDLIGPERIREVEPHAAGVAALHVPGAAIVDFSVVARRLATIARDGGATIFTSTRLLGVRRTDGLVLETTAGPMAARLLVNCAGLHSDRVAALCGAEPGVRIVPFRGEYLRLRPSATGLVRGLVYPVPDPDLPFLGPHLTRRIDGEVWAGPNAVPALAREGYRRTTISPRDLALAVSYPGFWRMLWRHRAAGGAEARRSLSRRAFAADLARLVPAVRAEDLVPAPAGVRAQAIDRAGRLIDDFRIVEGEDAIHVLNAPSPAATSVLFLARRIVELVAARGSGRMR